MSTEPTGHIKRRSQQSWLLAIFVLFLVVTLLWLPFGFRTTGLVEEWDIYTLLQHGYHLYFLTADSPIPTHILRPLEVLPHVLGFLLSHNSFFGLNVLAYLVVFSQSVIAYALMICLLPRKYYVALAAAVLFTIYPGDSALFAVRVVHIHFAVCLYLLAVYFLIRYWRHARLPYILAIWICLAISLLIYEVAYPVILITPLLLFWLKGGSNAAKRKRWALACGIWYFAPAAVVIRTIVVAAQSQATYEAQLLSPTAGSFLSSQNLSSMAQALVKAYGYQFVSGWQEALTQIGANVGFLVIAVLVAVVVVVGVVQLDGRNRSGWNFAFTRRYLFLGVIGLALIATGFAPYLIIQLDSQETTRVFFVSIAGSTLTVICCLALISEFLPRPRLVFSCAASLTIGLAMIHALNQQNLYVNYSLAQQDVLAQALEQAPHIDKSAALIIFDATDRMRSEWFFGENRVSQFRYIYGNYWLNAQICFEHLTFPDVLTECTFKADGLHIIQNRVGASPVAMVIPYNKLILFRYFDNPDTGKSDFELLKSVPADYLNNQTVAGYDPDLLIDRHTAIAPAVLDLFTCWPLEPCIGKSQPVPTADSAVEVDFSGLIDGTGWRDAETSPDGIHFRWTNSTVSTINVAASTDKALRLSFKIVNEITPEILHSLKVSANGVAIDLSSSTDGAGTFTFQGTIVHEILAQQTGMVRLAFTVDEIKVPPGDHDALGLAFSSLRLLPMQ